MKNYLYLKIQTALCSFVLLLVLFSCEKDALESEEEFAITADQPELAYPNQTGEILTTFFDGKDITVQNINGSYVTEGDILIPNTNTNRAVGRYEKKWPEGIVYYTINSSLPNKARVTQAIAHWEATTRIEFKLRTNQADYIHFIKGTGCSSFVGKIGGAQRVTLADNCSTGNTIHEIGHAVGLWHEQSSKNRDSYINILYQNIESGREFNFDTYIQQGSTGTEFTNFDFNSVMMYGSYFFSKNGQPTITKKNGQTYSINRTALSTNDKNGIASMYLFEFAKRDGNNWYPVPSFPF